jgi:hypothetical protein
LCGAHHLLKTNAGRTWRPILIGLVAHLTRGCDACEAEHLERYGVPFSNPHDAHVDPCSPECHRVTA